MNRTYVLTTNGAIHIGDHVKPWYHGDERIVRVEQIHTDRAL